jgi:hypothetical protein
VSWDKELLEKAKARQLQETQSSRMSSKVGPTKWLKPLEYAPPLRRVNGFGVGLYGWLRDPAIPNGHLKLYFLSAFWIPVLPFCAYAVTPSENGFRFHHQMSLWGVIRCYGWRFVPFYFSALIEGALWMVLFMAILGIVVGGLGWLFGRF